jgi:hypothetical protein
MRYGEEVKTAVSGLKNNYLTAKRCDNPAEAETGDLFLCSTCNAKYNNGLGDPRSHKKEVYTDWQGFYHNVHDESHVEGSKWWRKMVLKSTHVSSSNSSSNSSSSSAATTLT